MYVYKRFRYSKTESVLYIQTPNSSHSIYQQVTQLRLNKPIKQLKETNTIFELGSDHNLELKALKSKNVKLL